MQLQLFLKKAILISTFILLQIAFVSAQKIMPLTTPEAAGFSSERLKRLDREMNDWAQKEWMQGGAALIIRNGKFAQNIKTNLNIILMLLMV